jgi:hypothetical protein
MKLLRFYFVTIPFFLCTSCASQESRQPILSDIRSSIGKLLAENQASRGKFLAKCFRLEGFFYEPPIATKTNLVGVVPIVSVSGLNTLRKFGYGMADSEEQINETDRNLAIFNDLSPNQQLQYISTQKKCDKAEQSRSRTSFDQIQSISLAQERFLKKREVVAATKTWSRCMSKQGFDGLAKRDFSVMDFVRKAAGDEHFDNHQLGDPSRLRAAELRVANADANCLEASIQTLQEAWSKASE